MRDRSPTAAFAAVPLIAILPALGPCKSEVVLVETDCIEAKAFDVSRGDEGVSAAGGSISIGSTDADGKPCPPLKGGEVTFFREKNQKDGYQSPAEAAAEDPPIEPDEFVSQVKGHVSAPTGEIQIGSFTTSSPTKGKADSWEVKTTDVSGGESFFSGTF